MNHPRRQYRSTILALGLGVVMAFGASAASQAQESGETLRVAILQDVNNFDPQSFLSVNFPLIKNLYDSLIEYGPDGEPLPSLASEWTIAEDNSSVTLELRDDVTFHSGAPMNAEAVAATLAKAADPETGKNVYATMAPVADWTVDGDQQITVNFNGPVPDKQITDLLQFLSIIDPAGIETIETEPAGTGAFTLVERVLGQSVTLAANPDYWRDGEPAVDGLEITVFGDNDAAAAALESGAVDVIYGGRRASCGAASRQRLPADPGPGPAGADLPHQHDARPLPERAVPAGLQLPARPRRHPARRLCRLGRGHGPALGPGEPGRRPLLQRDLCLSTSTRRRSCSPPPASRPRR